MFNDTRLLDREEMFDLTGYKPAWAGFARRQYQGRGGEVFSLPKQSFAYPPEPIPKPMVEIVQRRIEYQRCGLSIPDTVGPPGSVAIAQTIRDGYMAQKSKAIYNQMAGQSTRMSVEVAEFESRLSECFYYGERLSGSDWAVVISPVTRARLRMEIAATRPFQLPQVQDWDCGYCGSRRTYEEVKCWDGATGCGGPNDQLAWRCVYCGRTFQEKPVICWDGVDGCGAIGAVVQSRQQHVRRDGQIGVFGKLPITIVEDPFLEIGQVLLFPQRVFGMENIFTQEEYGGDVVRDSYSHSRRGVDIESSFRVVVRQPETTYSIGLRYDYGMGF